MLLLKSFIFILFLICFKTQAENLSPFENPAEPRAFQAPGVERVGASPLPLRNQGFDDLPMGKTSQDSDMFKTREGRKNSFETTYSPGRVIYLNGENISSIRGQELESVNIRIDNNGNVYIEAPQYEVNADQSYHPLLPTELPKFKKENIYEQMPIPNGVFSKQTGKSIVPEVEEVKHNAELATSAENDLSPDSNVGNKTPKISPKDEKANENSGDLKVKEILPGSAK